MPAPPRHTRCHWARVCSFEQTTLSGFAMLQPSWVRKGFTANSPRPITAAIPQAVRRAPLSEGVESHRFFSNKIIGIRPPTRAVYERPVTQSCPRTFLFGLARRRGVP